MKLLLDSVWRAAAYLFMPRVFGLTLLPLLVAGGLTLVTGYFFYEPAVDGVRNWLETWSLTEAVLRWLDLHAGTSFRAMMAIIIVLAVAIPVVVVLSLLLVAAFMTPALVSLVAERRFPGLERLRGGNFWRGLAVSLGATLLALVGLLLSAPLWLVPPLALIIPPLIWGWLTTRVMSFDALAEHASEAERLRIRERHHWPLLMIGIITGYLGAAPTLLWAVSAATLILAPFLIVVSIWLYTLVFAFSALWFVHYCLGALRDDRLIVAGNAAAAARQPVDLRELPVAGPGPDYDFQRDVPPQPPVLPPA
ncbi:MAG TPA: EI24 domain-containing protein [Ideonella sp.]|uniref:EI24 domain-containing protein n=1 Tax=Ideonella sp. TaxID=1929293 RepID=UPI002C95ECED|nr:EI24 domain-containing protein [Ideonella sp.]HSI47923.1 EI24 domain-containing protein [Ideonella sp.]